MECNSKPPQPQPERAYRQNAKKVLEGLIKIQKARTEGYEVLLKSIVWDELSKEDEAALWEYFRNCKL